MGRSHCCGTPDREVGESRAPCGAWLVLVIRFGPGSVWSKFEHFSELQRCEHEPDAPATNTTRQLVPAIRIHSHWLARRVSWIRAPQTDICVVDSPQTSRVCTCFVKFVVGSVARWPN